MLAICLFHTDYWYFSNGYIGVDIFFVISGYLITGLIVVSERKGTFSLPIFYLRRVRRLLPALFFMMLVCIPFAWSWMFSSQYIDFSQSLISSGLFGSNILFWLESQEYFSSSALLKPLLHTWSLSLEEQFYLVYPVLLLSLVHLKLRFRLFWLALITSVFGIYSVFFIQNSLTAHYMLHARLWLFGLGALTYCIRDRWPCETYIYAGCIATLGVISITLALLSPILKTLLPIIYSSKGLSAHTGVSGVVVVLLFAASSNFTGRILSNSILIRLGIISYSLYLWHYPLIVFAKLRLLTLSLNDYLCLLTASLILAYLSWRFVEQPFRDRKLVSAKQFVVFIASAALLISVIGIYGVLKDGYVYGMGEKDTALDLNYGLGARCQFVDGKPTCAIDNSPNILVWGDSFAMHTVGMVIGSKADASVVQLTMSSCSPILRDANHLLNSGLEKLGPGRKKGMQTNCLKFRQQVVSSIYALPSLEYAVISSRFSNNFKRYNEADFSDLIKESAIDKVYDDLLGTLNLLQARGIKPVIVSEPRRPPESKIMCAAHVLKFGGDVNSCAFLASHISTSQLMTDRLLRRVETHYSVIWLDDYICQNETCNTIIDNINIYTLGGHISSRGAKLLGLKLSVYDKITEANP